MCDQRSQVSKKGLFFPLCSQLECLEPWSCGADSRFESGGSCSTIYTHLHSRGKGCFDAYCSQFSGAHSTPASGPSTM